MKRAPEVGQRGGLPGRIFMAKKGQRFKKRAAGPRFILFLTGISDVREHKLLRKRQFKNGNLPLFCIEKDARVGVLYAPFACVLLSMTNKKERLFKPKRE